MRFSIIIPTLNEEKYLGKLLDSLVNQTFKDFEVSVVDGFSEDKTREVANSYSNKLDLRFIAAPERGVALQRNYGAKQSLNDDLVFFDADVVIEPDFLKKINSYLNDNPSDILTSWIIPMSERIEDRAVYYFFNKTYLETRKHYSPQAPGAFIYVKKQIFNTAGGFPEDVVVGEDMDFALHIHRLGYSFCLLKDPKVYFSVRRLDKEGRPQFYYKILKALFLRTLKGPIKDPKKIFYEWGKYE